MKICCVTGKRVIFGNNVSHAVNRTRRRFEPNIQNVNLYSRVLGKISLKITPRGLKTIEKKGGIDLFLDNAREIYGDEGLALMKRYWAAKELLLHANNSKN
ncbi:50S ribosomal protein L28 [Alphaproteobacteria bacterium endosymbiont of Tiliacea citrago]|uniref:50S ribosomal protein L28 n=1 Tax=Alphaproteobacteria bacterium endosymbiont of Tiliacea citrago TaxID=3077944 RepID=UPI00313B1CC3